MNRSLSLALAPLWLAATAHAANTAPTVVIQSAAMRGATGLMDIVFRVNDPDDATVKTRALAFIDGQRSFAKLVKPTAFADGTGSKIGDAIATNTDHTLTWNVATDWNIDLGQIKFEILAMDGRGLLPLNWVTIPAANGEPELTISKNAPTDQEVLDALFWQYASGDPGLTLENGVLREAKGQPAGFNGMPLATDASIHTFSPAYLIKAMNLASATASELDYALERRSINKSLSRWRPKNQPFQFLDSVSVWGIDVMGTISTPVPPNLNGVIQVSAGVSLNLALLSTGKVRAWGWNEYGQTDVPDNLSAVKSVSAGAHHALALMHDGSIKAWGSNAVGQCNVPSDLNQASAISAGLYHNLALESDGTVTAWGWNEYGQSTVPSNLSDVIKISAGTYHSVALKKDGTLVYWGLHSNGMQRIPENLGEIIDISAGQFHTVALRSNGTVACFGDNNNINNSLTVPIGLSNVISISAGENHSIALKQDGTIVTWGRQLIEPLTPPIPPGSRVTLIDSGYSHNIVVSTQDP
jgi:hypothetical protein